MYIYIYVYIYIHIIYINTFSLGAGYIKLYMHIVSFLTPDAFLRRFERHFDLTYFFYRGFLGALRLATESDPIIFGMNNSIPML